MRPPIQASIERAWREVAAIETAFAQGEIDEAEWHARMARLCVPAYLAGENPRAQSGYSGSETDWRQARELVADAIPRSGSFLDIGCASGHLIESVNAWCAERGLSVEPYGVDIAAELAGSRGAGFRNGRIGSTWGTPRCGLRRLASILCAADSNTCHARSEPHLLNICWRSSCCLTGGC